MQRSGAERARLVHAGLLLVCVRIGLRVLPFKQLSSYLDAWAFRAGSAVDHAALPTVSEIAGDIAAVARRVPATTCLAEALTAHALLRRNGHRSTLRIGTRRSEAPRIDAHAWVEHEGAVVVGRVASIEEYVVLS